MAEKTAAAVTYAGAGTAFFTPILESLGITPADVTLMVQVGGFWIGAAGLIATVYFKWQHLKLARIKAGLQEEDE